MKSKPPKLWLAWIYRDYSKDSYYIKNKIEELFGKDAKVSVCLLTDLCNKRSHKGKR